MAPNSSLEVLLRTLLSTAEAEKKSILHSMLRALREACAIFYHSDFPGHQEMAKRVQEIFDSILSIAPADTILASSQPTRGAPASSPGSGNSEVTDVIEEEEWEEEFVESGTFNESAVSSEEESEQPAPAPEKQHSKAAAQENVNTPQGSINRLLAKWNSSNAAWLKLPTLELADNNSVISFVCALVAVRSNMVSNNFDGQTEMLQKFDANWLQIVPTLKDAGFHFNPENLADKAAQPAGKIIYTCRTRNSETEREMIAPGISLRDDILRDPVWVIALPIDNDYSSDHVYASLPSHWRGIFGETEALLEHLAIQPQAFCAVEGINKNRIDTLDECRAAVISELKRRLEVLYATILKGEGETAYRLATDYWRVEEFFWSVFHDDDRPSGCSYFDRLRNRLQGWRTVLRRVLKFHIRDFACGSDSLASINKYIGNIILQPQKNVAAGMVTRELRPAIVIKDQGTDRLLKGRVIAT